VTSSASTVDRVYIGQVLDIGANHEMIQVGTKDLALCASLLIRDASVSENFV